MAQGKSASAAGVDPAVVRHREVPAWLRGVYAGLCLYLFLAALNVIGSGLGTFGEASDFLVRAFEYGENPFIALLGAVLVTAIVQSSSFTTALIVTLVATGEMTLGTAVFAIMGANIGTSVTALLVALANMRIRRTFRRSFTAALLHDFFNILTVAVLFPLEWVTSVLAESGRGVITQTAAWLAELVGLPEVARPDSPVGVVTAPIVAVFESGGSALASTGGTEGLLVAAGGLVLMFFALVLMVKNLRGALLRHMDGLFRSYFFRTDPRSYGIGAISTVMVQSSTITTSLMVPLAGAGVVPMRRVLPFMMGSNLGTTATSVLAATANPVSAALTVAFVHVLFNLLGTAIWYPLRYIPIRMASWYGRLAGRSMPYAFLFLFLVFLVLPLVGLAVTEVLLIHR
ncbi:Na/Pi symporter [Halorhodospira halophila]|uniref:Na/Pi symporter n=1 Tax=Halorhodospira halophila TaxID=1053 RepID=UPI001912BD25|nr:Na/Pi symporter [Halorhodospira halophila]MBK5936189.1 sodium:phosphate symporter [Halorhodospira halophila]